MEPVKLEVIMPHRMFYKGEVVSLSVGTVNGEEGFMKNHEWCCKLIPEQSILRLRETGAPGSAEGIYIARIKRGYVEIKDSFAVYTEDASWDGPEPKGAISEYQEK